jgi:hypothetical protein
MTNHQYGPKGHIVDAFLEHLKQMTGADWLAVNDAWCATSYAEWGVAWDAAWASACGSAAGYATSDTAGNDASDAAKNAPSYVSRNAAGSAAWEILGADLLRERGQPFFFLPMFGFADEQAIIKQESTA